MNSILKGFYGLLGWLTPRTTREQLNDLDDSMQKLYDRMGWGVYHHPFDYEKQPDKNWLYSDWYKHPYPTNNCTHISGNDIDRILEAEKSFNDYLDDYVYNCRLIKKNKVSKDPARPRKNI